MQGKKKRKKRVLEEKERRKKKNHGSPFSWRTGLKVAENDTSHFQPCFLSITLEDHKKNSLSSRILCRDSTTLVSGLELP